MYEQSSIKFFNDVTFNILLIDIISSLSIEYINSFPEGIKIKSQSLLNLLLTQNNETSLLQCLRIINIISSNILDYWKWFSDKSIIVFEMLLLIRILIKYLDLFNIFEIIANKNVKMTIDSFDPFGCKATTTDEQKPIESVTTVSLTH